VSRSPARDFGQPASPIIRFPLAAVEPASRSSRLKVVCCRWDTVAAPLTRCENAPVNPRRHSQAPFAEELPRLLTARGISQRHLATQLGINSSHLSRALRGTDSKRPSPELIAKTSEALQLPPDYFPEAREAAIVAAVRNDPALRDRLYRQLKR
jgi:Helix-turn-helix